MSHHRLIRSAAIGLALAALTAPTAAAQQQAHLARPLLASPQRACATALETT